MQTRLSNEEFDILHSILDKIPVNEKFAISYIHAKYVLKPLFPRATDGTGLTKYDKVWNDYTVRGVYVNITNFLLEQNFADAASIENVQFLILTNNGELLQAYGGIVAYNFAFVKSSLQDIISRTTYIIEKASPYGEFTIEVRTPNTQIVDFSDFLTISDEEGLKRVNDALDQKKQLLKLHQEHLKNEEVLQYLINEGFAINRHDIKVENKIYRQLTEKGRKLKEVGSIEAYNIWAKTEKDKVDKIENDNDTLRQTNITIGKIQSNLLLINRWIALAGIVAALYYLILMVDYFSGLINKHLPLYLGLSITVYLLLLGVAIGISLAIILPRFLKVKRKNKGTIS